MTHVHYKFSSKLSYDTVVFDGPHITLKDLKRQIMGREKLRAGDCDLQITNAQTKEEYTDEEGLIPKGSSVIVRRIPNSGVKSGSNSKTRNTERSDVHLPHPFGAIKAMDDQSSSRASPLFSKMANLADVDASEEDKIQVMLNQSIYDSMNYNKKFGAALPSNYTCYRCGNTGHHIRNCPTSGLKSEHQDKNVEAPLRLKKSTGIPRSFMVEVDDPNIKGAMLTNSGRYAIPALHAKAYAIGKKEKPPFLSQEQLTPEDEEDPVPNELRCLICHDLLSDAVVIPCCGNSYCDDCVRTALLDSDDHICPTCGQSDVSPDTLIPNKFLRQAVNTFKKEQGQTKSLRGRPSAPQSQNPTPTPSPVPTPPPINMQIQPQKPQKSTHSQQDPLLQQSQTAGTSSSSQACGAPPTAMSAAPDFNTPSTSLQPLQSHPEISDKEAEERTQDDSVPASPSILVSSEDPTAAAPQPIPLVDHTPEVEQRQTVSVNLQQSSSAEPAPVHPGPSQCWKGSSSSSSGCPTRAWSESNSQQPSPSTSSYPTAPPPLFPSPLFHTFLAAQQPLNSYPPGYPPATPVWTLPAPQGAPVPSLCSSASTSSIPALIPKDWYMHQRRKKERSPHRASTYSRSPSRSHSKSSKSKSSRSYSHSSSRSRSRSRSRSQGRSRPHSPYSRHRDLHTRPHSSHSYSYGYKRSPTPSSSSSPRGSYRSRSKSPSDHRKSSHHSRHHNKKSSSCRYSSRKRGEHSQREAGGTSYLHAQGSSLELDRERYQQWKKAYKDWCEKYFNSYVGHFHQLPPPLLSLPPSPPPQWGGQEGSRNHSHAKSESRNRHAARMDDHSPPSQSSSDSRSPPSQSSSDSRSTPSQSSSDSRSSLSHSPTDSGSPPSQSSTDRRSTSSEDVAQPRTLRKGSKEADLQVKYKDDKLENHSTLKHEQKSKKKHKRERGEVSSSPEPSASIQDKVTARKASEAVKTLVKPDKHLDKERKGREERNLDKEEGGRQGKLSHSKRDIEKQPKEKPNNRSGRVDTDRFKSPEGSKASDSRSERTLKRKGEDVERSSAKAQSSKYLKTKIPEVPQTQRSEPLNPEPKMEKEKQRKTWPLTKQDIWEGEIKVKPQKKISININLETKRKEENMGKQDLSCLESIAGKPNEEIEKTAEEINRAGTEAEANDNKESNRNKDGLSEGKMIPEKIEMKPIWEKDASRHDEREMEKKHMGERKEGRQEEDFDLWHCALRGVEEEQETSKKPLEEPDRMEASKEQEVTNEERTITMGGKEEERRVRNDGGGQEMGELITNTQEGESTLNEKRGNPLGDCTPKEELMDGVKWRMRTEEQDESMMRSKSQRSRNESHHDGPNTAGDDGSTHEVHQERKMELKTLEEYTQDGAAGRQEELITQVPRSKWEKEESEREEQDEPGSKVKKDALTAFLPSSSSSLLASSSFASVTAETPTERETEGEYEQQRLEEKKRDKVREMERGKERDKEKNRSVAPSSGRDRPDNASSTERDRERQRESEKLRQKESKTSKERIREEEKRRDRAREKGHGSRNPHSSSRSHSYSTSRERERQRGDDRSSSKSSWCAGGKSSSGRSSSISRAGQVPDENAHKTSRGTFLDLKSKDKHYFHNPQDPPGNYRLQDRSAGTHHSPSSHRESWGKQLPSESSSQDLAQSRNRVEKLEKEEWKQNKVEKVIKEAKWERDNEVAEREGSFQWEDEADKLEEGERPSSNSVSSSTSQESSSGDDGGKEQEKKHKREKRRATPELQEEEELKKHKQKKKSKKSRDSGEEWSSGEVDNKWEEEEDGAKLYSVMLF